MLQIQALWRKNHSRLQNSGVLLLPRMLFLYRRLPQGLDSVSITLASPFLCPSAAAFGFTPRRQA